MAKIITPGVLLLVIFSVFNGYAQGEGNISGVVLDPDKKPVPYINAGLTGSAFGAVTNEKGKFTIPRVPEGNYEFTVSGIGYHSFKKHITITSGDSLFFRIELTPKVLNKDEVVVTGTLNPSYVRNSPVKVEVVTRKILTMDPSGSIMGSATKINGINEQVACGVCGTNSLRINGMEGPYTLILIDGMPVMGSLASVYGLNGIPSSLVEKMEVIKGPSSTIYGSEAMGGVINIITRLPESAPLFSINSFFTTHFQSNTDITFSPEISEKVSLLLSGNFYSSKVKIDDNGDNFTDFPLRDGISFFNKLEIKGDKGSKLSLASRLYYEDRSGGELQWEKKYRGSTEIYGESIYTGRVELFGSYIPGNLPFRLDASFTAHDQNSFYGDLFYKAFQSTAFLNLLYLKKLNNHNITGGITAKNFRYEDNSPALSNENRFVPGVFIQDEWKINKKVRLLTGGRVDYHDAHGFIFSPRISGAYYPGDWTTFRINGGKGFRQVNLFTEDHAALTGSRNVIISEKLEPEESWNITLNLNHVFNLNNAGMAGTFDLDVFYTAFSNKIIPDYDSDPNLIIYKNLRGEGISKGVSASVGSSFKNGSDIKIGFSLLDVYVRNRISENEVLKKPVPFTPAFSSILLSNIKMEKLRVVVNPSITLTGPQPLPDAPPGISRPDQSPAFVAANLKVSFNPRHNLEVYAGVKNILNFTQQDPLILPETPFDPGFDTTFIWGPMEGRRSYVGITWHLDKKGHKD